MSLAQIVAEVEEARGRRVLERLANPGRPAGDLPIRHHRTGQIVAWIPEQSAIGLVPVILCGLVVGYYKDTNRGRIHPMFGWGGALHFVYSAPGEEWANDFTEEGCPAGAFRVRKTPF